MKILANFDATKNNAMMAGTDTISIKIGFYNNQVL